MSYDVSVHTAGSIDDPDPEPLGPRAQVIEALERTFPGLRWVDPHWGDFADSEGSAEFNLGTEDPVKSFAVHLRGIFIPILQRLDEMADEHDWEVFDWQDG